MKPPPATDLPSPAERAAMAHYRNRPAEKERVTDLMRMVPENLHSALDIGARDGFLSRELAACCARVTALDLDLPLVDHPRIDCVQGDATALRFPDGAFDLVFCAEVLEHIPSPALEQACAELARVARSYLLVGVPYKQDIRHGRTTCAGCGKKNPPWGHVNRFDQARLGRLFPGFTQARVSLVGQAGMGTNFASALLLDLAGNPFGTYVQSEPCVHCGARLSAPPARTLLQKCATRGAHYLRAAQARFHRPQACWIHVLFRKND